MRLDQTQKLVDHLIRSYRLSGIAIRETGKGACCEIVDDVGLVIGPGMQVMCCSDAATAAAIMQGAAARLPKRPKPSAAAIAAALQAAADAASVPLTTHADVVERAQAAVEELEGRIRVMQATGGLREVNDRFKVARLAGTFSSYNEFMHVWKKQMLEKLAAGRSDSSTSRSIAAAGAVQK